MKHWHVFEHIHSGNILYAIWTACVSFFAPVGWWLVACAYMVIADFITGCWAARKRGEMWSSTKFRESLYKCTSYMFLIICARVFESVLPSWTEQAEIARLFAGAIVGIELYSVIENFYKATGHRVFYVLTQITSKKLKDITGEEPKGE